MSAYTTPTRSPRQWKRGQQVEADSNYNIDSNMRQSLLTVGREIFEDIKFLLYLQLDSYYCACACVPAMWPVSMTTVDPRIFLISKISCPTVSEVCWC